MALFGKKYTCHACGMKFRSEAEMREHGKMHMAAPSQTSGYHCASCNMSFRSQAEFDEHKRKAHSM